MTGQKKYDVVAVGAVCVDIQIRADEDFLAAHGMKKGLLVKTDAAGHARMLAGAEDALKTSGGAATNVVVGIALRGGRAGLMGKVAGDAHGRFFSERVQALGVDFTPLVSGEPGAATSTIAVVTTPDKQRSFALAGGAAYDFGPEDVDPDMIRQARIVYLDSFLWLSGSGKAAVHHAAEIARAAGARIAVSLNNEDIIAANQKDYRAFVERFGDITMGDRKENMALYAASDVDGVLSAIHAHPGLVAAVTAGGAGSQIVSDGAAVAIPRKDVPIVDTTGAGDQYAAGFLYGLANGLPHEDCGRQGASWAADALQHRGGEPRVGINAASPAPSRPVLKR